jgi:large subunit ribosomal protein L15
MSMNHEITSTTPRNKRNKRKGRGESSGRGKTSGKGNKGSKARTGKYIKRGYEGGQTTIFRRFPKRGFSNQNFERRFYIVNLTDLERFDEGATIDAAVLKEAGLIPDFKQPVKILSEGEFTRKLTIVAGKFSKPAHAKILQLGGEAKNMKGETFEFPKPKKKFIPREPVKKSRKADAEAPAEGAAPGKEAAKKEAPAKAEAEKPVAQ